MSQVMQTKNKIQDLQWLIKAKPPMSLMSLNLHKFLPLVAPTKIKLKTMVKINLHTMIMVMQLMMIKTTLQVKATTRTVAMTKWFSKDHLRRLKLAFKLEFKKNFVSSVTT